MKHQRENWHDKEIAWQNDRKNKKNSVTNSMIHHTKRWPGQNISEAPCLAEVVLDIVNYHVEHMIVKRKYDLDKQL